MKKMTLILLIATIFFVGLTLYQSGRLKQYKTEIEKLNQDIQSIEKEKNSLDDKIAYISNLNKNLEQKLTQLQQINQSLEAKLKETDSIIAQLKEKAETMTPDDMVLTSRQILGDEGIFKTADGAAFTLSAFRKNTVALMEWREFTLSKIPTLTAIVDNQKKQILNYENQIFLWKEKERLWQKKDLLWYQEKEKANQLIKSYVKELSSQKRQGWLKSVLFALAGLGAGLMIHR